MAAELTLLKDSYSPQYYFPPHAPAPDPLWTRAGTFVQPQPEEVLEGPRVGLKHEFQAPGNIRDALRDYSTEMVNIVQRTIANVATGNIPDAVKNMLNDAEAVSKPKSFKLGYGIDALLTPAEGITHVAVTRLLDLRHETKDGTATYEVATKVGTTRLPELRGPIPSSDGVETFGSNVAPYLVKLPGSGRQLEVNDEITVEIELSGLADHALDHVEKTVTAIRDFIARENDQRSILERTMTLLRELSGTLTNFFKDKEAHIFLNSYTIQFMVMTAEQTALMRSQLETAIASLEGAALGLDGAYAEMGYDLSENPLKAAADSLIEILEKLD